MHMEEEGRISTWLMLYCLYHTNLRFLIEGGQIKDHCIKLDMVQSNEMNGEYTATANKQSAHTTHATHSTYATSAACGGGLRTRISLMKNCLLKVLTGGHVLSNILLDSCNSHNSFTTCLSIPTSQDVLVGETETQCRSWHSILCVKLVQNLQCKADTQLLY